MKNDTTAIDKNELYKLKSTLQNGTDKEKLQMLFQLFGGGNQSVIITIRLDIVLCEITCVIENSNNIHIFYIINSKYIST